MTYPTGHTTLLRRWINVSDVDSTSQQRHVPVGWCHIEVLIIMIYSFIHSSTPFFSVDLSVMTVIANDVDSGNNGSVMYSLKQVPMKGSQPLFSIDTYTGLISTRLDNALDRETQPEYTLIVQAQDRGSPAESCEYDHRMNMELVVALTTLMSTTVDILWFIPSKLKTFVWHLYNVWPTSKTLG